MNKYFEYADHLARGEGPWHSTFLAIYFTLTGLHGLHIVGGMAVMAYLLGRERELWKTNPEQFTNRIEYTAVFTGTSSTWCGSSCFRCCTRCEQGVTHWLLGELNRGASHAFRRG